MEETNLLTCKICGKSGMKKVGFHVRKKHHMSMKEYNEIKPQEETSDGVLNSGNERVDREKDVESLLGNKKPFFKRVAEYFFS